MNPVHALDPLNDPAESLHRLPRPMSARTTTIVTYLPIEETILREYIKQARKTGFLGVHFSTGGVAKLEWTEKSS